MRHWKRARLAVGAVTCVLLGSCAGSVTLENRPCPCVAGYECCARVNLCIASPAPASCDEPAAQTAGAGGAVSATVNEPHFMSGGVGQTNRSEASAGEASAGEASAGEASAGEAGASVGSAGAAPLVEHDRWLAMSVGPLAPRYVHSAVWAGDDRGNGALVIWGGLDQLSDPGVPIGDGARYYPREDRWAPISQVNAPAARYKAATVWTGSRVLLWGGDPIQDYAPYSYDPIGDTWETLPSCGCDLLTDAPFAAWTGSELLLFGAGQGARFEPATGQWRMLSRQGAPYARFGSAVWTGKTWLLWGGAVNNDQVFAHSNFGAQYDPATDTWTPISTLGAPSARENQNAAWTGTRMIIWGGYAPTAGDDSPAMVPQDSAAYDPETDSWTALPALAIANAPLNGTVSVNDGHGMIVWGQRGDPSLPPSGGRLDFATLRWSPLSELDQPQRRLEESATWTGAELVIWGGNDGPPALASGARYFP